VGYWIDAWGLPSVLSALGILFSIAFVFLLLPLVLSPGESLSAERNRENGFLALVRGYRISQRSTS